MDAVLGALRAAAEPSRLRLLSILSRSELTVSEITQVMAQSQPRVSRHLKLLTEAGLIDRFREGSWVFYRLADGRRADDPERRLLADLAATLVTYVPPDDAGLSADLRRLENVRAQRAEKAAAYFKNNAGDWSRIRALHLPEQDVEQAMLELLGPGDFDQLVDIGTGTGRVLELLGNRIARGVGIDLSFEMLTLARAGLDEAGLVHCQVRQGDLFALPFEAESTDLVTVHQVLHFLDDPANAVREAARIIAPGGRLLIVDFAPHELEFLREEHQHRRLGFADEEIAAWAKGPNLEVIRTRHLPPVGKGDEEKLTVSLWLLARPCGATRNIDKRSTDKRSTDKRSTGKGRAA